MNRFAEIEAFVTVIETGSFSAASERKGVAVSAISRRVDELEARLNVKLTQRSKRGVKATDEGRLYYDRCIRLLSDLTEADNSVSTGDGPVSGLIRIACPPAFCLSYLAPLANEYAAQNPEVQFDIDMSDRAVDLIQEGFDFAIRIGHIDDPSLTTETLFPIQYVVAASPEFWNKHGRPETPEDLAKLPVLVYRIGPGRSFWSFTGPSGRTSEVQLSARIMANNGTLLVEAARAGLGVCLEPRFVCANAIRDGSLEAVLADYQASERVAELVRPSIRPLSQRAASFANVLRTQVAAPAPWDVQ